MASLLVRRAGLLTTVQDLGRAGWGRFGVPVSGAMDRLAARVANALVSNPPGAALLELTGPGAALALTEARPVAIAGADLDAAISDGDGDTRPLPPWSVATLQPGQVLSFQKRRAGARAVVAVAGGLDVASVFGSAATDPGNRLGAMDGRPLRAGDQIALRPAAGSPLTLGTPPPFLPATYGDPFTLRLLPAPNLPAAVLAAVVGPPLTVTPQSNRIGFRLALDGTPSPAAPAQRLSEPIAPGTVQLPPDGQPILLMADRQTVGGYPVLGHVIAADLPRAAQLWPGDRLRFSVIDADRARTLARQQADAVSDWLRGLEATPGS